MKFFKKMLVILFPFFFRKYAENNPKAEEWAGVVIAVIEAQYGPQGLTREAFLRKFDAEILKRGGTPELVALAHVYAEKHLDKAQVR